MQLRGHPTTHLVLLSLTLLLPAAARGGGFEYGSNGTEAMGRAGAFAVRGDNPTSLYYNVGTMGRMEPGTHLLLDCNLSFRSLEFQRLYSYDAATGEADWTYEFARPAEFGVNGQAMPSVRDTSPPMPGPFLGVVTDFGLDSDFVFGLGVFGPSAVGMAQFPAQVELLDGSGNPVLAPAPQRYDLLSMNIIVVWPTLSVAYRITDDLSVGVGFQPAVVHISYHTTAVAAVLSREDAVNDLRAGIDVWDPFMPAGIFGIWYRPWRYLEVGLSTRISGSIDATGELITVSNPYGVAGQDPVASDTWTDYDTANGEHAPTARVTAGWPILALRAGARFVWPRDEAETAAFGAEWTPEVAERYARMDPARREWFDIEADFVYEMNSDVQDLLTKVEGVVPVGNGLPNIAVRPAAGGYLSTPHNWVDTFAVRLGGDVNLLDGDLSLRWGFFYESAAVPHEWTRLDFTQWESYGVSGGITYRLPWYGLEVAAGYQHVFMPDRYVTNGSARMMAAINVAEDRIPVINNGRYSSSLDILSLGVTAHI